MTGPVLLQTPPSAPDDLGRFGWWEVRRRLGAMAYGAAAGGLAGFFLAELGFLEIVGASSSQIPVAIGAVVGAALGMFRLQMIMLALDAVLAIAFFLIANTPLMYHVASSWVRSDRVDAPLDAIVVLSARVNSDGYLSDQGVQRLLTGLELYRAGVAPRLFTTAVEMTHGSLLRSSTADQERIVTLGGARGAWTSLTGVYSTHDEAMQAASQLPASAHRVAVVTAPMHTRRACATFEAVGFRVVCVPSREQEYVAWHPLLSSDRIDAFRQYLYERLGMVKYRAKGWLPKES